MFRKDKNLNITINTKTTDQASLATKNTTKDFLLKEYL